MALFLGNSQVKIATEDGVLSLNFCSSIPITNGMRLLSSDGYILKDANGLYLTTEEED